MSAIELNNQSFNQVITNDGNAVLVDFWASWCNPCRRMAPVIDELSEELHGKVKVCKLNVDENRETASLYGVMSIPTMIYFKNGKEKERFVGVLSKNDLKRELLN